MYSVVAQKMFFFNALWLFKTEYIVWNHSWKKLMAIYIKCFFLVFAGIMILTINLRQMNCSVEKLVEQTIQALKSC